MKPNETGRFIPGRLRLSRRRARLLSLVSLAAALALELTPWGVVLSFFAGPDRTFLSTCSLASRAAPMSSSTLLSRFPRRSPTDGSTPP